MPLQTADIGRGHETFDEGLFAETPQASTYDFCAHKAGDSETTAEAHEDAMNVKRWHYGRILECLAILGQYGMTTGEYVKWLELYHKRNDGRAWAKNDISGRFTELKEKYRKIVERGISRNGCKVHILAEAR